MTAPLIGITTRVIEASSLGAIPKGIYGAHLWGVFADYCEAVSSSGGIPVMIPRSVNPGDIVAHLDGLLLSGGEDVDPNRYNMEPVPESTQHDPERDEFEFGLVSAAIESRIPILAICRGCQVVNVARGGTLIQHLPEVDGFSHAETQEHRSARRHSVAVAAESMLRAALGADVDNEGNAAVNSYHHQAIDEPGNGLRIVAWAPDGTIEAVESAQDRVLAVQWHPEMHSGVDPIFNWLISESTNGSSS
ncbi:MAG: gamma-glutamyl-gamma-aminobutyrate hydrolase family protein [Actinomycetota bacterium]|nr:gamma-glutamyl-gamma-aminobutyrate hydrolase family protein [Actinomycetota bacterium]